MDTTAFDLMRHYLLCDRCGAPVDISNRASNTACNHCQAPIEVRLRPEAAARRPARNENERRAVLADQDRRFVPPADVAHFFAGERVAASLDADAHRHWQGLRALLKTGDTTAAESFFFLSKGLAERCVERGDPLTQRAVVDSALELLSSVDHAQVLKTQVARSALRAGDSTAAEVWLSTCDPTSEHLLADTSYRYARAYLDTARGDHRAVVRTLGSGGDIPLSEAYASECAVLCANAWEKLEQPATAVDALVSAKRALGPIAGSRIARFVTAHRDWQLCTRSEPEAERRSAAMDSTPAEGSITAAVLLLSMGAFSLLWVASAIALFASFDDYSLGDMSITIFTGGLLAVLFIPIGLGSLRRALRLRKLRARGRVVAARVVACEPSSEAPHNGRTSIHMKLLITPDDAPAYYADLHTNIMEPMIGNFEVGSVLVARMGSGGPDDFTLEVV